MAPARTISAAAALVLLSGSSFCQGQTQLESCQDLIDAFELTKTQDVEVVADQSADLSCPTFTTMSMDSNTLTVLYASEPTCSGCRVNLGEIRFEVTNGAKLFWEPEATFTGTDLRDVDGGAVYVGEGSTVRFYNDVYTADVGIASVPREYADFATYQLTGGCVYVDGYFRVDGEATFERCENSGGGESPPGPAGVMYVGATGSVLFNKVTMREVSIIDNEGNNGGGIYNLGKVNFKGNAVFEELRAEGGGAIFNAGGAEMRFKQGATAVFNDCLSFEGVGGSVYNDGYLKFSGPTLFLDSRTPTVYVGPEGYTRLSEDSSVFWGDGEDDGPAVLVADGGRLTGAAYASFVAGAEDGCATIFFEDGAGCQ